MRLPQWKRGQTPFVRSTLRAVPAKGVCPLSFPCVTSIVLQFFCDEPYDKELSQVLGQSGQRNRPVDLLARGVLRFEERAFLVSRLSGWRQITRGAREL